MLHIRINPHVADAIFTITFAHDPIILVSEINPAAAVPADGDQRHFLRVWAAARTGFSKT
jgi:hypothetical protein